MPKNLLVVPANAVIELTGPQIVFLMRCISRGSAGAIEGMTDQLDGCRMALAIESKIHGAVVLANTLAAQVVQGAGKDAAEEGNSEEETSLEEEAASTTVKPELKAVPPEEPESSASG